jgi:quercetin dioxygenase-like cupin family protein
MTVRRLDDVVPGTDAPAGVTVRVLKRVEDVELKVLDVEPDGSSPFHMHSHGHEGVVVAGAGALRLADRSELLSPGDVFSIDPNEPHAIECHGAQRLRLVCLDCFID